MYIRDFLSDVIQFWTSFLTTHLTLIKLFFKLRPLQQPSQNLSLLSLKTFTSYLDGAYSNQIVISNFLLISNLHRVSGHLNKVLHHEGPNAVEGEAARPFRVPGAAGLGGLGCPCFTQGFLFGETSVEKIN